MTLYYMIWLSYYIVSYNLVLIFDNVSNAIVSYDIVSYNIVSYDTISYRVLNNTNMIQNCLIQYHIFIQYSVLNIVMYLI